MYVVQFLEKNKSMEIVRPFIKSIGIGVLMLSCLLQFKAATIVVTNNNDAGAGSLRDAVGVALVGDVIDMTGLTGTITLTTGEINIIAGQDIFLVGPGYNNLTIDCNNNSRAFNIYDADVSIDSLTIINGKVNDNQGGGGIRAIFGSSLTISYCLIKDCESTESLNTRGGAIDVVTYDPDTWNENGPVTVLFEHSQIENSKSYIGGGARFVGNTLPFTIDINNCTFKDNATGPFGALSSGNDGGALEIVASQSNNAAVTAISIVNSTFSGNNTQGPWNASSGAALSLGSGMYNIHSCTFSNNTSINNGGAIDFWGMSGSCTLTNTIVAQNTAGTTGNDFSGTILSGGYNLIGDADGATFVPTIGDITGTLATPINALLFPLALNGGFGETHAMDCSSPAIDVGGGSPPPLDQIGNGVVCSRDIGAFEYQITCCAVIMDTLLICQGDSLFTGGNWENTAGIYGDTTIQIFNPNITTSVGTLCPTSTPVLLSGTPFGGTWSGTGIMGNSFDPAVAGVGTFVITYTADSIMGSPSVTVTCTDTLSITVVANPSPGTNGVANLCSNTTLVNLFDSLGAAPSTGGVWSPVLGSGTGIFDPSIDVANTYTYTVTDCAGNPQSANVVVTVGQTPNTGTDGSITMCTTDPITDLFNQLGGTPQLGGAWSPAMSSGTGVFDPGLDVATTYTYTITNSCGTSSNDVVVTVNSCSLPVSLFTLSDDTICLGDCINLMDQSTGATSWLWTIDNGTPNSSTNQQPTTICFNTVGSHTITQVVSNVYGSDSTTTTIFVNALPIVIASPDVVIKLGESTSLTTAGTNGSFTWSPPTWLDCSTCIEPIATPEATTTYTVTIVDSNGCVASDDITVNVDYELVIFVPNIFSPNGDGNNDVLYVRGVGVKSINFFIYDRWGEMVFESQSLDKGWDGSFRGEEMNNAVFVYYLKATFIDGTSTEQKGDITLTR